MKTPTNGDSPSIVILGEALVDFFPYESSQDSGADLFQRSIGGAPSNLSVGLVRLGSPVRLLTMLGEDTFGRYLHHALGEEGVDTTYALFTSLAPTGVTFVTLSPTGERSFTSFTRDVSAEWVMRPDDFKDVSLEGVDIFHLGTNLMPHGSGCSTTMHMLRRARAAGCLVTMDVNLRLHHWGEDPQSAVGVIREALSMVDVLKVSEEEMHFFLHGDDDPEALYKMVSDLGVRWLLLTKGAGGAQLMSEGHSVFIPAFPIEALDMTGAGDGFCAGLIHGLSNEMSGGTSARLPRDRPLDFDEEQWRRVILLGSYVGAQVCTRLGATTALPYSAEIPWSDLKLPYSF